MILAGSKVRMYGQTTWVRDQSSQGSRRQEKGESIKPEPLLGFPQESKVGKCKHIITS
jgi:hypothetical protein